MKLKFIILLFIAVLFNIVAEAQVVSGEEISIDYNAPKDYTIGGITVS